MRTNIKKLLICLAVPLAVGGLAAALGGGFREAYAQWNKPPLSPPGWVFPVVWTALYLLMGWASWLVADSGKAARPALVLYGAQLLLNFLWPILFFRFRLVGWALLELGVLWVLIYLTMVRFSAIRAKAGDLLIPYLVWSGFALYLNGGIFFLN